MEQKRKYYKTVVKITVLSEDEPLKDGISLEEIAYEITDGHCSGDIVIQSRTEVKAREMAKLLMEQGSDPEFFRLDEDGNELED